jgi:hypothetical protein
MVDKEWTYTHEYCLTGGFIAGRPWQSKLTVRISAWESIFLISVLPHIVLTEGQQRCALYDMTSGREAPITQDGEESTVT